MTAAILTTRDVTAISCWAHSTWRVARSLSAHTPDRPEAEGGTITGVAAAEFGTGVHYGASRSGGITIHRDIRRGPRKFDRELVHHVPWTTVASWLDTWTTSDRYTLIQLEDMRYALQHTADDLHYDPAATLADHEARAQRRQQRMDAGDRNTIRTLTTHIDQLVADYLTGRHSPANQLELF